MGWSRGWGVVIWNKVPAEISTFSSCYNFGKTAGGGGGGGGGGGLTAIVWLWICTGAYLCVGYVCK